MRASVGIVSAAWWNAGVELLAIGEASWQSARRTVLLQLRRSGLPLSRLRSWTARLFLHLGVRTPCGVLLAFVPRPRHEPTLAASKHVQCLSQIPLLSLCGL
jgi:hypothetical protein